eukprot:GHVO01001655.1.p2 GENE.GHVO01001655.1~~GHVO01001655.1.p2  ORF type:complete len:148 (-),score=5.05 GHVO01001655.1:217-660(-)
MHGYEDGVSIYTLAATSPSRIASCSISANSPEGVATEVEEEVELVDAELVAIEEVVEVVEAEDEEELELEVGGGVLELVLRVGVEVGVVNVELGVCVVLVVVLTSSAKFQDPVTCPITSGDPPVRKAKSSCVRSKWPYSQSGHSSVT